MKRVLIAFEQSGQVRRAFGKVGIDAWSVDLEPSFDVTSHHIQGEAMNSIIAQAPWDLIIAHPPCTYLCSSGLHWNKNDPARQHNTMLALAYVRTLMMLMSKYSTRWCLENPVGCISTQIRKPDQYIQPWQFGENASKKTCLWLKMLPELSPTSTVQPRMVKGKPRWGNQTDSGQNKLGPSESRSLERAVTYRGIAEAMAQQWGNL